MPKKESVGYVEIIVCYSTYKSNWTKSLLQSIWEWNYANQDMPKITGWFNLGTTQNSTIAGVVPGADHKKEWKSAKK